MSTFDLYRFSPGFLRQGIHSRLCWSVKHLIDALPKSVFVAVEDSLEKFFLRLHRGDVDGCDFSLHHHLLLSLIADDFEQAQEIIVFGANRKPLLKSPCLDLSSECLGCDAQWYEKIFAFNDLPRGPLKLTVPDARLSARCRSWIDLAQGLLQTGAPKAHSEWLGFRPVWLIASVSADSAHTFGGYSSSLAWGTVMLNANRDDFTSFFVQVIHELAHQLLFALALDVPLAFNDPLATYTSPLRSDPRPMDGVLHAYFVSARIAEVLDQIKASAVWLDLSVSEQLRLIEIQESSMKDVKDALPVIDSHAELSALGERVVSAARQTIQI